MFHRFFHHFPRFFYHFEAFFIVFPLVFHVFHVRLNVIYLLPESGGRLPDGTRVLLQELVARADLNGKAGNIASWDFALQRYTVEIEKEEMEVKDLGLVAMSLK